MFERHSHKIPNTETPEYKCLEAIQYYEGICQTQNPPNKQNHIYLKAHAEFEVISHRLTLNATHFADVKNRLEQLNEIFHLLEDSYSIQKDKNTYAEVKRHTKLSEEKLKIYDGADKILISTLLHAQQLDKQLLDKQANQFDLDWLKIFDLPKDQTIIYKKISSITKLLQSLLNIAELPSEYPPVIKKSLGRLCKLQGDLLLSIPINTKDTSFNIRRLGKIISHYKKARHFLNVFNPECDLAKECSTSILITKAKLHRVCPSISIQRAATSDEINEAIQTRTAASSPPYTPLVINDNTALNADELAKKLDTLSLSSNNVDRPDRSAEKPNQAHPFSLTIPKAPQNASSYEPMNVDEPPHQVAATNKPPHQVATANAKSTKKKKRDSETNTEYKETLFANKKSKSIDSADGDKDATYTNPDSNSPASRYHPR